MTELTWLPEFEAYVEQQLQTTRCPGTQPEAIAGGVMTWFHCPDLVAGFARELNAA